MYTHTCMYILMQVNVAYVKINLFLVDYPPRNLSGKTTANAQLVEVAHPHVFSAQLLSGPHGEAPKMKGFPQRNDQRC